MFLILWWLFGVVVYFIATHLLCDYIKVKDLFIAPIAGFAGLCVIVVLVIFILSPTAPPKAKKLRMAFSEFLNKKLL